MEPDGTIYGVLATSDVDQAFRDRPRSTGSSTGVQHVSASRDMPEDLPADVAPEAWSGVHRGPLAGGGVGTADRQQGPTPQHLPRGREALLLQPRPLRPRRAHRSGGGLHGGLVSRRGVPRVPPTALRVRRLDAARRRGGLPQGRGADRGDGRHLPRCPRGRGRSRLRCAHVLPAARGGTARPSVVVRTARGVRRRRPPERHPVLRHRRDRPPGLEPDPRRPGRGAAPDRHPGRPGHPRHARALGLPGRHRRSPAARRASSARTSPRRPSCPGSWRPCARTEASPSRQCGSPSCGTGTSRAWPCGPGTR